MEILKGDHPKDSFEGFWYRQCWGACYEAGDVAEIRGGPKTILAEDRFSSCKACIRLGGVEWDTWFQE